MSKMAEVWKSPVYRERLASIHKNRWKDKDFRSKMKRIFVEMGSRESFKVMRREVSARVNRTYEYRCKMSETKVIQWKDSGFRGRVRLGQVKSYTEERKKRLSDSMKKVWSNVEFKKRMCGKKQSGEMVAKRLAKVCQRPNLFEKKCGEDLERRFPGKFKYTGNGSIMIGGKSPDYVSEELRIVVLCNGLYWHLWQFGLKDTVENRQMVELKESEPFRKVGYEVWFIWEER